MFRPQYTITDRLLATIKEINTLIIQLNNHPFPHIVRVEFERSARALSTFASTSIEGNPLPLTEVKKILKSAPNHLRESEREIVNYNTALKKLNQRLDDNRAKLSLGLILEIQKYAMAGLLQRYETGRLREKSVVVNDPLSGQIVYMPPNVEEVRGLMDDLIGFITSHQNSIDPLILAGIFHKQMVIIHPFTDGNGRTTRLTTKVLLAKLGLNTFNLFSFENYYNKNVTKYFQKVGEYGDYYDIVEQIDFTAWLEYFTEGIIDELLRIKKLLPQTAGNPHETLQDWHRKLLSYIQKKGYITDHDYSRLTDRAKAT